MCDKGEQLTQGDVVCVCVLFLHCPEQKKKLEEFDLLILTLCAAVKCIDDLENRLCSNLWLDPITEVENVVKRGEARCVAVSLAGIS